jgi:hypothetical protein
MAYMTTLGGNNVCDASTDVPILFREYGNPELPNIGEVSILRHRLIFHRPNANHLFAPPSVDVGGVRFFPRIKSTHPNFPALEFLSWAELGAGVGPAFAVWLPGAEPEAGPGGFAGPSAFA